MKNVKSIVFSCFVALTASMMACGTTDGANGSTGATGPTGQVGGSGAAGANGANGAQGAAGASGAKGDSGEQGVQGDAGVSLCGDVQMPEWHKQCGTDLVGACATTNARWECHLFLTTGSGGDVTQELAKVCADATTHVVVSAPASAGYGHSPVPQSSGRCDMDGDCDGVLDQTVATVNGVANVHVGDQLARSGVDFCQPGPRPTCRNTRAVCDKDSGNILAGSWVDVAGATNLGKDCFNTSTQLEQSFGCSLDGATWFAYSDDGDATTDTCEIAEGETQYSKGVATSSCVAPADAVCVW